MQIQKLFEQGVVCVIFNQLYVQGVISTKLFHANIAWSIRPISYSRWNSHTLLFWFSLDVGKRDYCRWNSAPLYHVKCKNRSWFLKYCTLNTWNSHTIAHYFLIFTISALGPMLDSSFRINPTFHTLQPLGLYLGGISRIFLIFM
jgi:hypothetical protein